MQTVTTVTDISYTIGEEKLIFNLPQYDVFPQGCDYKLVFKLLLLDSKEGGEDKELPSFIRFDPEKL